MATGISQCGSGVGQFVFAPLATFLLMNFGWEAVIWVVAGLYLMCAVFGALLRPLELKKETGESGHAKKSHLIPSSLKCWESKSDGLSGQRVSPFSRTDLFYYGTAGNLMKADSKMQGTGHAWEDVRGLLFVNPR